LDRDGCRLQCCNAPMPRHPWLIPLSRLHSRTFLSTGAWIYISCQSRCFSDTKTSFDLSAKQSRLRFVFHCLSMTRLLRVPRVVVRTRFWKSISQPRRGRQDILIFVIWIALDGLEEQSGNVHCDWWLDWICSEKRFTSKDMRGENPQPENKISEIQNHLRVTPDGREKSYHIWKCQTRADLHVDLDLDLDLELEARLPFRWVVGCCSDWLLVVMARPQYLLNKIICSLFAIANWGSAQCQVTIEITRGSMAWNDKNQVFITELKYFVWNCPA
jgi:hypothetical protein